MRRYAGRAMVMVLALVTGALLTGCATNIRKASPESVRPTSAKLSTFKTVGMKTVVVAPKFAAAAANEKARKKINELLIEKMKLVIPELKVVDAAAKEKPALVIEPVIEEVKFVGGGARFMVGAMAGSSAVMMKVTFRKSEPDEVLGAPEFYKAGSAMGGAYSMGRTDNLMLEDIVNEIVMYTKMNL